MTTSHFRTLRCMLFRICLGIPSILLAHCKSFRQSYFCIAGSKPVECIALRKEISASRSACTVRQLNVELLSWKWVLRHSQNVYLRTRDSLRVGGPDLALDSFADQLEREYTFPGSANLRNSRSRRRRIRLNSRTSRLARSTSIRPLMRTHCSLDY